MYSMNTDGSSGKKKKNQLFSQHFCPAKPINFLDWEFGLMLAATLAIDDSSMFDYGYAYVMPGILLNSQQWPYMLKIYGYFRNIDGH